MNVNFYAQMNVVEKRCEILCSQQKHPIPLSETSVRFYISVRPRRLLKTSIAKLGGGDTDDSQTVDCVRHDHENFPQSTFKNACHLNLIWRRSQNDSYQIYFISLVCHFMIPKESLRHKHFNNVIIPRSMLVQRNIYGDKNSLSNVVVVVYWDWEKFS